MYHRSYEDEDGNWVQEFDDEGIDYLIKGLEELRDQEPGTEMCTPSVSEGEDGGIESMGLSILKKYDPERPS